jgi:CRP-like cAMP-binding protein
MNNSCHSLIQFIHETTSISSARAAEIASRFKPGIISRNEFLLKEGKICNELHFIEEGFMRSYTYNSKGIDTTTNFYADHQVVCEMFSFFKQVPAKESFIALTDCKTFRITFEDLQIAFHSMPEFREFGRAMLVSAYADLKQRMLSTLQETAEQRYSRLLELRPLIFQHAPLKQVASFLGITNSSLSRIRKDISSR